VVKASDGYVLVEATGALGEVPATMSRQAVVDLLAGRGIEAVPILTVRESSNLPQTISRKLWFRMTEDGTDWPMLASPLRLTATPPTVTHLALPMNNDREALLAELGLAPVAGG
jgi:crotonobetainyl-CoA:carnitine CoA-transferase CaiB-like acyl-CoA transferase